MDRDEPDDGRPKRIGASWRAGRKDAMWLIVQIGRDLRRIARQLMQMGEEVEVREGGETLQPCHGDRLNLDRSPHAFGSHCLEWHALYHRESPADRPIIHRVALQTLTSSCAEGMLRMRNVMRT